MITFKKYHYSTLHSPQTPHEMYRWFLVTSDWWEPTYSGFHLTAFFWVCLSAGDNCKNKHNHVSKHENIITHCKTTCVHTGRSKEVGAELKFVRCRQIYPDEPEMYIRFWLLDQTSIRCEKSKKAVKWKPLYLDKTKVQKGLQELGSWEPWSSEGIKTTANKYHYR